MNERKMKVTYINGDFTVIMGEINYETRMIKVFSRGRLGNYISGLIPLYQVMKITFGDN